MISTQKGFIKIFAPNIVLLFFIKTQYIVIERDVLGKWAFWVVTILYILYQFKMISLNAFIKFTKFGNAPA